jgi:hypothetical protein
MTLPLVFVGGKHSQRLGPSSTLHYDHLGPLNVGATKPKCHPVPMVLQTLLIYGEVRNNVRFFANDLHSWLSHTMVIVPFCTSVETCLSQMTFFVQWLVTVYFTSIVNNAMIGCFLHFHEITPIFIRIMYPVVDFQAFCISHPIRITKSFQDNILVFRIQFRFWCTLEIPHAMFYIHPIWWTSPRHKLTHCTYYK